MPSVLILYHFFHPDDVVSARHFSDLARGLAQRGWRVTAAPSNRSCRKPGVSYASSELWEGISIRRVWRPPLPQDSTAGRLINSLWMIASWAASLRGSHRPDVVVIGTDPVLSPVVAALAGGNSRRSRSRPKFALWSFDLYPEAAAADGMISPHSPLYRLLRRIMRSGYHGCDLVVDLGSCMRSRLRECGSPARSRTVVPWALTEPPEVGPPDPEIRRRLFGECRLGLLYSGSYGRAHASGHFLALARRLRGTGISTCFAAGGNRVAELARNLGSDDENIRLAPPAPESELLSHLQAADIHLASLRPGWTGVVVPSKFFGSLAAGRPVLFSGASDSCIAGWIREFGIGWVLDEASLESVAADLLRLSRSPEELRLLQNRCHEAYRIHFSREKSIDAWDAELRDLLQGEHRV